MPTTLDAPIVAVTVYPHQARITRKGTAAPGTGDLLAVTGLPLELLADSVRVGGHGPATIAGVEVRVDREAEPDGATVRELRTRRRAARGALDEATDALSVTGARARLLEKLSERSAAAFAKSLANGTAQPARVTEVADALTGQLTAVLAERRTLAERHERLTEELAAAERALQAVGAAEAGDTTTVLIEVTRDDPSAVIDIEVSYVVTSASWESAYDVRLTEGELALTWHGMITQRSGEDWPECDLALSTARPANTVTVPDLQPWYLDRVRPVPSRSASRAAESAPYGAALPQAPGAVRHATATVEQGPAAATYRPARPVAVASDGSAHRGLLAELSLGVTLDHLAAPVADDSVYLRAVATNRSEHALPRGKASVFHGTEFVGTTRLAPWAPGEEVELALGVDDRIRVKRELVKRTAGKSSLSGTRKREAAYRITVGNHGRRTATVTVLDQIPVSRDGDIVVRDVRATPDPVDDGESGELGELRWRLELAPGTSEEISFGFRVDAAKGVEVGNWRE
ncbi:aspartate ammonia-lyase [Prauserella marina]|uniref:Uncharacterized protein n=1 Tax=Prauserella marina TaxID=530584 RepID=A0A222VU92_9PSEU|nr:DUF4139 domain-containing protein [Prauserella marina]ASR37478.1 aspartate ammonia-lyase [Prauserella marina]PWV74631.1 uncharacterized protein (TIGR02231 family) [Prauserella marina]SDD44818.1 conserved hypothetical protein [Prauserella marina]